MASSYPSRLVPQSWYPDPQDKLQLRWWEHNDPLLCHVRTRVKSPQTNGVLERFFGTLKYESHLFRGLVEDADALAVEVNRFGQIYNTTRPNQALDDRTQRDAYLSGPMPNRVHPAVSSARSTL